MPKKAMDYNKCVIYKIICNDSEITECYVGHTTCFKSRKSHHKSSCNNLSCKEYNLKIYQFIRGNGGWDNWRIEPIMEYPCETFLQARIKEEECRIELQAQLNTMRAYTNKEQLKEQKKNWREKNKEQIEDYKKKWRNDNKEQIEDYNKNWREKNREKMKQKKWNEKLKAYKETI